MQLSVDSLSRTAERQRLPAAFGTYVDPALAARLLEQGDDVFSNQGVSDRGLLLVSLTDGVDSSTATGPMTIGGLGSRAECANMNRLAVFFAFTAQR